MHASFDDRPLTDTEILDMLTVLVLAGLDTTRAELGYMFRHLATHPEHRQALIDDPQLIPSAVDEVLRYYTIVFGDGRKVTRDIEFHGVQLQARRHGLRAGVRRQPRPARLRARRTSSSPIASATTTWASPADRTAASASTWRGGRCRSRSRSGCE